MLIDSSTSYPLLALQALYHLSTDERRALYHLKWRVMDPVSKVYLRSVDYLVVNIIVTHLARSVYVPVSSVDLC